MVQNNLILVIEAVQTALYIAALFLWGYFVLVMLEVVICKDARTINTHKLLHTPVSLRMRLFKRSLRNIFYRISIGLFIGATLATLILIHQLWLNTPKKIAWILFHDTTSLSLIYLFRWLGHDATFFIKLKLFLKGELN